MNKQRSTTRKARGRGTLQHRTGLAVELDQTQRRLEELQAGGGYGADLVAGYFPLGFRAYPALDQVSTLARIEARLALQLKPLKPTTLDQDYIDLFGEPPKRPYQEPLKGDEKVVEKTAIQPYKPGDLTELTAYTTTEIELVKQTVARGVTDLELAFFLYTARVRKLSPFAKQIYAIRRRQGDQVVMIMQTGIDGYRVIAARTKEYAGTDEPLFGPMIHSDGVDHPEWAKVTTYRILLNTKVAFTGLAYWSEFRQVFRDKLGAMWAQYPRNQLAKCAEAQALRKGFPEELEGLEYGELESSNTPLIIPLQEQAESGETPGAQEAPASPQPEEEPTHPGQQFLDTIAALEGVSSIQELSTLYADLSEGSYTEDEQAELRSVDNLTRRRLGLPRRPPKS